MMQLVQIVKAAYHSVKHVTNHFNAFLVLIIKLLHYVIVQGDK